MKFEYKLVASVTLGASLIALILYAFGGITIWSVILICIGAFIGSLLGLGVAIAQNKRK